LRLNNYDETIMTERRALGFTHSVGVNKNQADSMKFRPEAYVAQLD